MFVPAKSLVAINWYGAGLGNRIKFTLCAEAVAKAEARDFAYVWPTGAAFEPALTEIWAYTQKELRPGSVEPNLTTRHARFARRRRLTDVRNIRHWRILGGWELFGDGSEQPWEELFVALSPVAEIRDSLERLRRYVPKKYVGVQVRASKRAHSETLAESPVQWFITRMEQMLDTDRELNFFVSCDDPEAEEAILKAIPSAFIQKEKGSYNSLAGVQAAVVDLYMLASSTYLLAPYRSSFVELAWILGRRKQILEDSKNVRPPQGALRLEPHGPSDVSIRNPLAVATGRFRSSHR